MNKTQYTRPEITKDMDVGYALSFYDLGCREDTFKQFDIIPDGHVWEQVIINYCEDNDIDLSDIDFDPESDLFAAYSENKQKLEEVVVIIDILISKPKKLIKIIKRLDLEDDDELWAPAEFIEDLKENDIDLSRPISIMFDLDFKSVTSAKKAGEICTKEGYQCFIDDRDDEVLFAAVVQVIPNTQEIEEKIRYFGDLANKLDGKLSFYDDYNDETDNLVTTTYGSTWVTYETLCKNT